MNNPRLASRSPLDRVARWGIVVAVVLGAAVLIGLIAARLAGPPRLPPLDRSRFEQARSLWQAKEPAAYDIEVEVTGRQAAVYRVEVREGRARSAQRNGQPLPARPRTMATWSVPGMFETIERDLVQWEAQQRGVAEPTRPQLDLRAQFHPEYGYPERYVRIELGPQAAHPMVTWQVVDFGL